MTEKISSGSKIIDDLLAGGLEKGIISTLYGPAGSGKSNIAMLSCVNVAKQGRKVAFIDTESSFSAERIQQISNNDYKLLMKNIILLSPASFEEQKKIFKQLNDLVNTEKISLVVIDSVIMLYRLKKGSDEEIKKTNKEFANQLAILSQIARKRNIPVLVTNQVYADFDKPNDFRMVGGDLLKYWSKCIVKLERAGENIRKASIFKHRSLPEARSVHFEITNYGLRETKKKFSLF